MFKLLGLGLVVIVAIASRVQPLDYVFPGPEADMTTPVIIQSRGYPVEIHQVVTHDGYILELHRIPYGRSSNNHSESDLRSKKKPVVLQHGMMATDYVWTLNPTGSSLGYILADQGYDVWMINSRGTTYSRRHVTLDSDSEEYWQFSWDEMGRYDVAATLTYILKETEEDELSFVGHSLGCTLFYIAMIEQPELNAKVDVMISLAPTTSAAHLNNLFRYLAPMVQPMKVFFEWTGTRALHANEGFTHQLTRAFCSSSSTAAKLCQHFLFLILGDSQAYYQSTVDSVIGHYPAGGSARTMIQLLQNYNSGENLRHFDYGVEGNINRYGSSNPPLYNLSSVTVPVYIMWAENDPFAPPKDTAWLASSLGNLQESIRIADPSFSHGDFIWSREVTELVHNPLLSLLL